MADVSFEDYTPPAEKLHELVPVVQQLIEQGPDKIATIVANSADEATAFLRGMQAAARQLDKGARKAVWEELKGGKVKVGVRIGQKFTRNRGPKDAEEGTTPTE